jgi:hypothetical protein
MEMTRRERYAYMRREKFKGTVRKHSEKGTKRESTGVISMV